MADGIGCECNAWHESECCCGVDWTSSELIEAKEPLQKSQAPQAEEPTQENESNFCILREYKDEKLPFPRRAFKTQCGFDLVRLSPGLPEGFCNSCGKIIAVKELVEETPEADTFTDEEETLYQKFVHRLWLEGFVQKEGE